MYDIIFVNARTYGFPIGLGQLASILIDQGFSVGLLDEKPNKKTIRTVVQKIISQHPKIIGLSGYWEHYPFLKEISIQVHEFNPKIVQIAGNWWASVIPEFILKKIPIDYIVKGEADNIIVDLITCILSRNNISQIKGISFKKNGLIYHTEEAETIYELEKLPWPYYKIFDLESYITKYAVDYFLQEWPYVSHSEINKRFGNKKTLRMFRIYSSRGCYGTCTFCSAAGLRVRQYSVKYVIDHILYLKEKYDIDIFLFNDSLTLTTKKWVDELTKTLIDRKANILFMGTSRGDFNADYQTILQLRKAGCICAFVGFESGSQKILDVMDKKLNISKYYQYIKWFHRAGIQVRGSLVLNMPGETEATLKETVKFARKSRIEVFSVGYASPYPGTQLFQFALKNGFIDSIKDVIEKNPARGKGKVDFDAYYDQFNFNNLPKKTLIDSYKKIHKIASWSKLTNWKYVRMYLSKFFRRVYNFVMRGSQEMKGIHKILRISRRLLFLVFYTLGKLYLLPYRMYQRYQPNIYYKKYDIPLEQNMRYEELASQYSKQHVDKQDELFKNFYTGISDNDLIYQKGELPEFVIKQNGTLIPLKGSLSEQKSHYAHEMVFIHHLLSDEERKHQKILDVGCTSGLYFRMLNIKNGLGMNVSEGAIANIRKNGFRAILGSVDVIPFQDNEFEHLLCMNSIGHFDNPILAMREMKRVTKGYIIISTGNSSVFNFLDYTNDKLGQHRWNKFRWTHEALLKLWDYVGLNLISCQEIYSFDLPKNHREEIFQQYWERGRSYLVYALKK